MSFSSIKSLFFKMQSLPFRVLVNVVIHKLRMRAVSFIAQKNSNYRSTYRALDFKLTYPLFSIPPKEIIETHQEWISPLAERALDHRFNLLGSGWVNVCFGMEAEGLEGVSFRPLEEVPDFDRDGLWLLNQLNPANVKYAREVWRTLNKINSSYIPVDWQISFKTGFRWSSNAWNTEMRKDLPFGVDIKEPWELSRMQHLPILAYASSLSDSDRQGEYLNEFQCQILDFICQNPPGFGVDWACPMDIAIRLVNWLVAYDFFRTTGASFDPKFERILVGSIHDHAQHVFRFREFSPIENNNHYLSNLCGLIFAAAYLPDNPSSRKWLKLALPALIKEVEHQFNPDGSNFEGSVSYHRLSAEMVAYTAGVVQRMHRERGGIWKNLISDRDFSQFMMKLKKMAEFSMDVTNSSGRVWQIGDNDNGRFLKLQPLFITEVDTSEIYSVENLEEPFAVENTLNHQSLVAGIDAILKDDCLPGFYEDNALDYCAMQSLLGATPLTLVSLDDVDSSRSDELPQKGQDIDLSGWNEVEFTFSGGGLNENLHIKAYADFGLYIFKSNRIHLVVRCGGRGRCNKAGHVHEDQFSICLSVDGTEHITDPGTYLYTPVPELRNRYRSSSAHFVPSDLSGVRDGYLKRPIFAPPAGKGKKCLSFSVDFFVGGDLEGNPEVAVKVEEGKISFYSQKGSYPDMGEVPRVSFSCGYGIKKEFVT